MVLILLMVLLVVLTACEPAPTPFPVEIIPPATSTPLITEVPPTQGPLRYGVGPNAPLDALTLTGAVVEEAALDAEGYDIIAAYGVYEGWAQSPVVPRVALLVNTALPPLNDNALADHVKRAVDPFAAMTALNIPGAETAFSRTENPAALREALANLGYPDGFALRAAGDAPGDDALFASLREAGVEVLHAANVVPGEIDFAVMHLGLVTYTEADARAGWVNLVGEANMLDLYTLPVSYRAVEGVAVAFTASGWPVVTR